MNLNKQCLIAIPIAALAIYGLITITRSDDSSRFRKESTIRTEKDISLENDADSISELRSIASQIEVYGAKNNGNYPTLNNYSSLSWMLSTLSLDEETLTDTHGTRYAYAPLPVGCDNSENNICSEWTISADLEQDGYGVDDTDGNLDDETQSSLLN